MYIKNLVAALFLFFSFPSFSQFSINVEGGMNYSNIVSKTEYWLGPTPQKAYYLSVAPNWKLGKKVSLNAELQYSLEGFDSIRDSYKYSYLRVVPTIEYSPFNHVRLFSGFNAGYKLTEEIKSSFIDWDSPSVDLIDDYDLGIVFGVKLYYKNLYLTTRFNMGLRDLTDIDKIDQNGKFVEEVDYYNRNIQVGLGYNINWNK